MSQQNRVIYLSSLGTLLLGLLIGVFLFAKKRRAKSTSSEKVVTHTADTSPQETLAYWTKEKMQAAQPAPMPVVDGQHLKKRSEDSSHS